MNLPSLPVFSSLPRREVERLEKVGREKTYRDGEFIFFQGDDPEEFIVIIEGWVRILKQSPTGKEVLLEILGAGDPVGAVAVLDKVAYPASAQAIGTVKVLTTGTGPFLSIAERYSSFVKDLFLYVRKRLRSAREAVPSLTGDPVEQRIASVLIRLAGDEGDRPPASPLSTDESSAHSPLSLPMTLTRSDVARMVGSTVETVIRIMSRWEKEGLISSHRGRPLVIPNIKKLKEIAGA